MKTPPLKPCPFCGGKAKLRNHRLEHTIMNTPRTDAVIAADTGDTGLISELAKLARHLEKECNMLRAAFGIQPDERIPEQETLNRGSILIDRGGCRLRVSPVAEELIKLEQDVEVLQQRIIERTSAYEEKDRRQLAELAAVTRVNASLLTRAMKAEAARTDVTAERDALLEHPHSERAVHRAAFDAVFEQRDRFQRHLDEATRFLQQRGAERDELKDKLDEAKRLLATRVEASRLDDAMKELAKMHAEHNAKVFELQQTRAELATYQERERIASGEMMLEFPHPDETVRRCMTANTLMRGERDKALESFRLQRDNYIALSKAICAVPPDRAVTNSDPFEAAKRLHERVEQLTADLLRARMLLAQIKLFMDHADPQYPALVEYFGDGASPA